MIPPPIAAMAIPTYGGQSKVCFLSRDIFTSPTSKTFSLVTNPLSDKIVVMIPVMRMINPIFLIAGIILDKCNEI